MNHYTWEKVTERIYIIVETYGSHHNVMQLLLGDEKAALIDTGMGVTGNLKQLIEHITSLPITCFLTHMHPDHVGASVLFDKCYMNSADESLASWALTKEKRIADLRDVFEKEPELRTQVEKEIVDCGGFHYAPMSEGDIFDLGNITLKVFAASGHTDGSVVLYCKEENALFTGDAIAPKTILTGERQPGFTPLKKVCEQLQTIAQYTDMQTRVFCGHVPHSMPVSVVDDVIEACCNALSKETPREEVKVSHAVGGRCYQEAYGSVRLIYDAQSL